MKKEENEIPAVSPEALGKRIYVIRGKRIMFDHDLAALYAVGTRALNQSVKRNFERFPEDFMFRLSDEEMKDWRSQIVTSNLKAKMSLRRNPQVFTEQGVAMLSSVLNSRRAVLVNIQIMRTFTQIRQTEETYRDIWDKLDELEKKYDKQFQVVFKAIKMILDDRPKEPPRRY